MRAFLGWRSGFLVLLAVPALGPVGVILAQSFDTSGLGEPFRFGYDAWRAVLGAPETLGTFATSLLLTVRVPVGLAIGFAIAYLCFFDQPAGVLSGEAMAALNIIYNLADFINKGAFGLCVWSAAVSDSNK